MATLEEISVALNENRRELVLHGKKLSKPIDENGIDERLFTLKSLNYLEIVGTSLTKLDSKIGQLSELTKLVLCQNEITELPSTIEQLKKLKLLNVSNNHLEETPEAVCQLTELDTLNFSMNKLTSLPAVDALVNLHVINIANNQLTSLPDGIFSSDLVHLSQIIASDNQITEISEDVNDLPHLNLLDLSNNKLTAVPATLSLCPKLKELNLKGNKFKDRRFGKMVDQCQTKSCLEYLHNIWKKENQATKKAGGKEKEKKKKKGKKSTEAEDEIMKNQVKVVPFPGDDGTTITVHPAVLSVRQYLVCCIVRNLDLARTGKFKSFITLQVIFVEKIKMILEFIFAFFPFIVIH